MDDFEEIYRTFQPDVFRFLMRMSGCDQHTAEELTQETFYQAFLSFGKFRGECSMRTWLFQIAKNVYGKEDTMITIQLDMFLAERYDMSYTDKDGQKKRPYIIHRTSMGCYERTLAWLIEKYAGKLPTWLCPEQVRILPISEKYFDYADKVFAELRKAGVDVTVDRRSEKIGYKIREARNEKVPYMLIVGEKEQEDGTVSMRSRYDGDAGAIALSEFVANITEEIRTKEIRKEYVEEKAE